jgi:hypothetical protein
MYPSIVNFFQWKDDGFGKQRASPRHWRENFPHTENGEEPFLLTCIRGITPVLNRHYCCFSQKISKGTPLRRRNSMKKNVLKIAVASVAIALLLTFAGTVWADEITDSINEALNQCNNNDYTAASESLSYALQLLGQKKGRQLQELLPQPLPGWTADEASSEMVSAVVMGGGINAERQYQRDDSSVTVSYTTDSPMLQGIMMMLSNPVFAAANGGKLEKIKGWKAIVKYDPQDKSGSIMIVVETRTLILIEGDSVALDDLKSYASVIDYQRISDLP